ncbi:MAG: ABC transporter permease subunit [Anaerolineales bacterium]|nr:ABC transporter permease subunit [Anaerolineales bacterium]
MTELIDPAPKVRSYLQSFLSLLIPGLGQAVAGAISRGLIILASILTFSGLTIWTAAQRPRFPDYGLTARAFLILLGETAALLLFIIAAYYLVTRTVARKPTTRAAVQTGFIILGILLIALAQQSLLNTALSADDQSNVYGITLVFGAALTAAMWLWNISDAGWVREDDAPSMNGLVFLSLAALIILGSRVTQVDLPKAVREYRDTEIILRQIVWPWEAAFVYEENNVEAEAKIQAPCPPGATGPEVNEPKDKGPWVVVSPTCGDLSERGTMGAIDFGTELTITGGGFVPGQTVNIRWENPIGNAFKPRGFGDTEIPASGEGTFETKLFIPDATISSTAQGDQIHRLIAIQTGEREFTGKLSQDMKLALQQMLVTIMMGMMATLVGVVLSIPLSFLSARNLMGSLKSTLQAFVGGVFGLVAGAWLGSMIAGLIASALGGLEKYPLLTFGSYIIFVLGGALLFYRLAGASLDWLGKRALPAVVARLITIIGLAAVGATIGYGLGIGFSYGIFSITHTAEFAEEMAPRTGAIGAAVGALLIAYYGYRRQPTDEITTGNFIYVIVRVTLNIIRSIEPLIWAIIGIIWVGPGPFAGFIALTIHTIAALGKLYSEAIESIDPGPIEAVQSTGADRLQTIRYAVVPQILPPFIAFTIYRWDINVRLSTIIGLVGGGGIGFLLIQWIRLFQYEQAGIAVWLITITVAALDFVSAEIRGRFV